MAILTQRWDRKRSSWFVALLLCALAPAAWAQETGFCADPAGACAVTLPSACRPAALDAAAVPAGADCSGAMDAYRACLTRVIEECGQAAAADPHRHPDILLMPSGLQCQGQRCEPLPGGMVLLYSQEHQVAFAGADAKLFRADGGLRLQQDLSPGIDRFAFGVAEIALTDAMAPGLYLSCVIYGHPEDGGPFTLVRGHRISAASDTAIGAQRLVILNSSQILRPGIQKTTPGVDCADAVAAYAAEHDVR